MPRKLHFSVPCSAQATYTPCYSHAPSLNTVAICNAQPLMLSVLILVASREYLEGNPR